MLMLCFIAHVLLIIAHRSMLNAHVLLPSAYNRQCQIVPIAICLITFETQLNILSIIKEKTIKVTYFSSNYLDYCT